MRIDPGLTFSRLGVLEFGGALSWVSFPSVELVEMARHRSIDRGSERLQFQLFVWFQIVMRSDSLEKFPNYGPS